MSDLRRGGKWGGGNGDSHLFLPVVALLLTVRRSYPGFRLCSPAFRFTFPAFGATYVAAERWLLARPLDSGPRKCPNQSGRKGESPAGLLSGAGNDGGDCARVAQSVRLRPSAQGPAPQEHPYPRPTEAGILSASLYFVTVLRATL